MISVEKARKLRKVIETAVLALALDSTSALECAELFPAWKEGEPYFPRDRVQYRGVLYECAQTHTSQADWNPPTAASLWSPVTVDTPTGYDEWKHPTGTHDAYNTGDRVVFEGVVYESLIDGNTYSPSGYPQGWAVVGDDSPAQG